MNPLKKLHAEQDQAVWLDFVARGFVQEGGLKRLVDEDGLRGVTSNPAIFEKAIGHSDEYDDAIKAAGDQRVIDLYEGLAIADIQAAADVLRPVFDASGGQDGFVSLEVSPYLALNTAETLAEARRLHAAVARDNLMVKVPATPEGIPAIRDLTADGININVTLLFSQDAYEQVANAYIEGLEKFAAAGGDVSRVASVASFFISRIDAAVDKRLDEKVKAGGDGAALEGLKGKVAIANAKLAYRRYKRLFAGDRWEKLAAKGAHPQRLLWASTGVKSKAYSDVLYVEELIGPNTVNTIPPATMDAFRDHGTVRASLEEGVDEAERVLADLAKTGIDLDAVARQLVEEGVQLFVDAADKLLGAVAGKRQKFLGTGLDRQALALGSLDEPVKKAIETWRKDGLVRRLWQRDASVWSGADEAQWLGWLSIVEDELAKAGDYAAFAAEVKQEGFTDAVVLGMGGSSLGPEVLAETFGQQPGFPRLRILDSTDPDEVRAVEAAVNLERTLFIVASKSGSTLEPNVFRDYFLGRMRDVVGHDKAGRHFVAVTDPGSAMEKAAKDDGFRRIFYGVKQIGGRYSVLSAFGLVPAAAMGLDVTAFLESARVMVRSCGPDVPPDLNPGVQLGLVLGKAATEQGRDKVTLIASPGIDTFGAWAEQLIAESTGKEGKGLIPIDNEPLAAPAAYGNDRVFVQLRLEGATDAGQDSAVTALEQAGHPVVRIDLASKAHLPQEFFRFEIATAVAGAVLGINPFDQPDVEASKIKTRELFSAAEKDGALPAETPVAEDDTFALYTDPANADALRKAGAGTDPVSWIKAQIGRVGAGDYVALLAYVTRNPEHLKQLQEARMALREARHVATCAEFGPRFLHSTGQAYKGGPDSGVFLQITSEAPDLAIPGRSLGFATVIAAQARGDFGVLSDRGRRALRVHIKGDVATGLDRLKSALS
ncbi:MULTISPECIES: bifunctional transaldolase/phosoglucose isomerase [Methylobacterium]|jgi:transaldolase/glucose-6-phosphate isomerase|uniref:bifunctional transaldolase/phosoglucose isomerase n=1 Tax=Methylobacterium TaxID=407 RepID=UPI0008E65FCE|nr:MULTISPECIES: bifunctional transaldolase/phosoglucose isomerase [Methylobacterium]MBZ6411364.1 bifunctional transaldolase/phosoglucose isomerase [Methylobacterium sp.]MBK3399443.1 bifunctional transaldolase/phosoglucose isomerase [Methylobacterium ajmalii]MBK3406986.1 bifunctional transaldolase/phosoglucose isomerase [Methylobacterium ajmalii]MBK3421341.1 bifunctional transaldolase/phosoglucose isomerase [Methylobacterium ajmalii]SFE55566.1 transaldolase [Methylobacterium sp. yr596]